MDNKYLGTLISYANKDVFQKRLAEGFTKVVAGRGPWVKDQTERLLNVFAFSGIEDKVATYEIYKMWDGHQTRRCSPVENMYNTKTFEELVKNYKLALTDKQNLAEVLKIWNEVEVQDNHK